MFAVLRAFANELEPFVKVSDIEESALKPAETLFEPTSSSDAPSFNSSIASFSFVKSSVASLNSESSKLKAIDRGTATTVNPSNSKSLTSAVIVNSPVFPGNTIYDNCVSPDD